MRLNLNQIGDRDTYARVCRYLVKVVSVLVIPLILTIFTVVFTFEQKRLSIEQRTEDQQNAREERRQDLNISNFVRRQDREIAQEQRTLERTLANERTDLEYQLAEKVRLSNEEQRKHELYIQEENHRDVHLTTYINDIGQLLKESNGSLTSNPTIAAIAHAKTLHASRLIGSVRCSQMISFLYDAGQLFRGQNPLDISGVYLNNIDLSDAPLRYISLVGAHLNNASFIGQDISEADFRSTHLNRANFSRANCTNANFESAIIDSGDFSNAILFSTVFRSVRADRANFRRAHCFKTIFEMASMIESDFSYTNLTAALFKKIDSTMSTFHSSYILEHGKLTGALPWRNVSVRFMHAKMSHVDFGNTSFPYSQFIECIVEDANFRGAHTTGIVFQYCDLERSNLTDADMLSATINRSSLAFANFSKSSLFGAIFLESDISYADLSDLTCTIKQYMSSKIFNRVLSKHKVIGCNGTILEDPLVQNGYARCDQSVFDGWKFKNVEIDLHPNGSNKCIFIQTYNSSDSFLSQSINLSRFENFIRTGDAAVTFRARVSTETYIILQHERIRSPNTDSDFRHVKSIRIPPDTDQLPLRIEFPPMFSGAPSWLEYIELTIVPRSPET